MDLRDAFRFSWDALRANRLRTLLTALGLVIGNASVILVVTISLTSREYILDQISSIGSNMVYAYYEGAQVTGRTVDADFIKTADVERSGRNWARALSPRQECSRATTGRSWAVGSRT